MKTKSMEIQNDKFSNLKADADTQILLRHQTSLKGYDVMIESWVWDGIAGQSVIFYNRDVENFSDDELINLIKEHYKTVTVTISRASTDYVFLNFNFMVTI